jgi:hypothetical protein
MPLLEPPLEPPDEAPPEHVPAWQVPPVAVQSAQAEPPPPHAMSLVPEAQWPVTSQQPLAHGDAAQEAPVALPLELPVRLLSSPLPPKPVPPPSSPVPKPPAVWPPHE